MGKGSGQCTRQAVSLEESFGIGSSEGKQELSDFQKAQQTVANLPEQMSTRDVVELSLAVSTLLKKARNQSKGKYKTSINNMYYYGVRNYPEHLEEMLNQEESKQAISNLLKSGAIKKGDPIYIETSYGQYVTYPDNKGGSTL